MRENCSMGEMILLIFLKNELFHLRVMYLKQKKKEESEEESEEELDENKFFEYIQKKSKNINYELFKDYFKFLAPTILEKKLFEIKDKNKYNKLVN